MATTAHLDLTETFSGQKTFNKPLIFSDVLLKAGSVAIGTSANTHINLGVTSQTGYASTNKVGVSVLGGDNNLAYNDHATICGGTTNSGLGANMFIGGGHNNVANGDNSVICGGGGNTAAGSKATVGGGWDNLANNGGTVPGGESNEASGTYSLAVGFRAKAVNAGSMILADYTASDFSSTTDNTLCLRFANGVAINTNAPKSALHVAGLAEFTDNSDALANGLTDGAFYRTGDLLKVVH